MKNPPAPKKIVSMLASKGVTKEKICNILNQGLSAMKTIVIDRGEAVDVIDYETRRKYVETILDAIGEKKLIVDKSQHVHFVNILQQIRAYDDGDKSAIEAAGAAIDAESTAIDTESAPDGGDSAEGGEGEAGQVAEEPEGVLPRAAEDKTDVETAG